MKTRSKKEEPIVKHTPDGERIEISPYIWSVMCGAPPRYLEDEDEAIEIAKKLGWKADPSCHALGAIKPVSDEEMVEIHRILREHGIDPDEIDRILDNGGGTLPGWDGKKKTNSDH
jgi:hypothetical protein